MQYVGSEGEKHRMLVLDFFKGNQDLSGWASAPLGHQAESR